MIYYYGALRKKFGKCLPARVHSAREVVKASEANMPGFRNAIIKDRNYLVVRGDTLKKGMAIEEREITMKFSEDTWHILPVPMGYGGKGLTQTIVGVALIAVGAVMSFTPLAAFAPYVISMGIGIALGGLAQMFAPNPKSQDGVEDRTSYIFNGASNTVKSGGVVPIAYGETFVGSIVASASLNIIKMQI